jgi:hypothetical protein
MRQTSLQTTLVDRNTVYNNVCNVIRTSEQCYLSVAAWCGETGLITFGSGTRQTSREKKVVLLMELHRAIIYTTKISKQVTKSHARDAVHMYSVN